MYHYIYNILYQHNSARLGQLQADAVVGVEGDGLALGDGAHQLRPKLRSYNICIYK